MIGLIIIHSIISLKHKFCLWVFVQNPMLYFNEEWNRIIATFRNTDFWPREQYGSDSKSDNKTKNSN